MASDGGPDWVVIGGGIATALTALGAIIAGMRGQFKGRANEAEQRQEKRDTAATANADRTLDGVFRLIEQLQEEVARKSVEIERVDRICMETKSTLLTRIGELEAETRRLEKEVRELKSTRD